jgi:error-prone DNA polymerase
LRADVLPLFAAADAGRIPKPEIVEPTVPIASMTAGGKVVQDYASVGLTLRQHPAAFLRIELRPKGIVRCVDLLTSRDGQRVTVAGLVLVRQRPGTATGVIFMTIEDETGIANLVVWSSLFERQRRIVLSASMVGCRGRVQREGDVIHLVAEQLEDLTPLLRSVRNRDDVSLSQPAPGNNDTRQSTSKRPSADHSVGRVPHGTKSDTQNALRLTTRSFR